MTRQVSAIWVGNPYFSPALADLGWRVHQVNPALPDVLGWDALVADAGFTPDIVVVGDKSTPPFVTGMEKFPCLTAFYAVDTHIHSWFPFYAQGFDLCLVSLRDHIPLFLGARLERDMLMWSPPYARPEDVPLPPDPAKPLWDVLFVGTVAPEVNPERCAFLDALRARVPGLHVTSGAYRELYPQAKIVLNHAASGDLNFRVFEALGCGACLVTPFVRHGLKDLFENGVDFFTFDQNDIDGLVKLLDVVLAAPTRREKVAAHGHETVLAGHYMHHRAEAFAAKMNDIALSGKGASLVGERLRSAKQIRNTWLKRMYLHHAETAAYASHVEVYLAAARG